MAVEILERWKKDSKKSYFFLNGPATPPPSFFVASLIYMALFPSLYYNLHNIPNIISDNILNYVDCSIPKAAMGIMRT